MQVDSLTGENRMAIQKIIVLVGLLAFGIIEAPPAIAAASAVPTLDTRPTCADAAQEISVTRTVERCQESEQEARASLAMRWSSFSKADEASCAAETRIGGFPSYVQLLTCLEMARDARSLKLD
jgi:hypothetical protein